MSSKPASAKDSSSLFGQSTASSSTSENSTFAFGNSGFGQSSSTNSCVSSASGAGIEFGKGDAFTPTFNFSGETKLFGGSAFGSDGNNSESTKASVFGGTSASSNSGALLFLGSNANASSITSTFKFGDRKTFEGGTVGLSLTSTTPFAFTPSFGSENGAVKQVGSSAFGTKSIFGQQSSISPFTFGGFGSSTATPKLFESFITTTNTSDTRSEIWNLTTIEDEGRYVSISAMREFEFKSQEELRYDAYRTERFVHKKTPPFGKESEALAEKNNLRRLVTVSYVPKLAFKSQEELNGEDYENERFPQMRITSLFGTENGALSSKKSGLRLFNIEKPGKFEQSCNSNCRLRRQPNTNVNLTVELEDLYHGATKSVKMLKDVVDTDGATSQQEKMYGAEIKPEYRAGTKIWYPKAGREVVGYEPADVVLVVVENPHSKFKRIGDDLEHNLKISLVDLLLGSIYHVTALNGITYELDCTNVVIKLDTVKTIKGAGMPIPKRPGEYGDLVVRFDVDYPAPMSEEMRRKIREVLS